MSINVSYVEDKIYRAEWQGDVKINEVIEKMALTSEMATENDDKRYVLIVDLTYVKSIPFDLLNLQKIADSDGRVACYVVVEAPIVGQVLGKMLNKVTSKNFIFADELQEAIEIARTFVSENMPV